MELSKDVLKKVGTAGAAKVSEAFSKLSKQTVNVSITEASTVPITEIVQRIQPEKGQSIIAYTQMIEGVQGASVLTMTREKALTFIDLLNGRQPGTTGILMDLDRSAIKETLNILSNSFLTELSKMTGAGLMIGAPHMLPVASLEKSITRALDQVAGDAVVFKTVLEISGERLSAELYVVFSEKFGELIQSLK